MIRKYDTFNRPERASLQDRSRGMSKDKISSGRILKANLRWHRKPGNGSKVNWLDHVLIREAGYNYSKLKGSIMTCY